MAKNLQQSPNLPLLFAGITALVPAIYIGYRINISDKQLMPISFFAVVAGMIFESARLSSKWHSVLLQVFFSYLLSLPIFLLGQWYHYSFSDHIKPFMYCFIAIFSLSSFALHAEKTTKGLSEGVTLLQSVALIYWIMDYELIGSNNLLIKSGVVIGFLFSLYSTFHAFTHAILSRTSRIALSVWSSVIMMLFACDNIYRVYQSDQINNMTNLTNGLYIGLQFFLLGVSCIYVIQNFIMLAGFLIRNSAFDTNELINNHLSRYSDRQASTAHSIFCALFTGTAFALNYYYQLLPRHVAIWVIFVTFPSILSLFNLVDGRRR
jgi:hypothetical protein